MIVDAFTCLDDTFGAQFLHCRQDNTVVLNEDQDFNGDQAIDLAGQGSLYLVEDRDRVSLPGKSLFCSGYNSLCMFFKGISGRAKDLIRKADSILEKLKVCFLIFGNSIIIIMQVKDVVVLSFDEDSLLTPVVGTWCSSLGLSVCVQRSAGRFPAILPICLAKTHFDQTILFLL